MSNLKLLNRDEYTLDQALDYLEKFHNEKRIDKSYLLYHARKGNLKTVIRLDIFRDFSGGENKGNCKAKIISLNNKKQVDDIYYLKDGSTQIIFNDFNINEENGLLGKSTRYLINRDHFFIDFSRGNPEDSLVNTLYYEDIQIAQNRQVYNNIVDLYFSAFFQIEPYCYIGDEEMILEQGFILKEVQLGEKFVSISTKNNEYISFQVEPPNQSGMFRYGYPPFKIDINDILILHKDLMQFVGIPEEESTNNLDEQIEDLKRQLEGKDKKIEALRIMTNEKHYPILLGEYREDDPLKIAIEVRNKYWANYPENVKSNVQIREHIIRDYEVSKTFAAEIEKVACPIDRKKN